MIQKILSLLITPAFALAMLIYASLPAAAQNNICPTAPNGTSNNRCASTAFVQNQISPFFISCPAHQWVRSVAAGLSICTQPAFSDISGTAQINQGGTGATSQSTAAINILPPTTRAGDLVYWTGTQWLALAGNNSNQQMLVESAAGSPSWSPIPIAKARMYPSAGQTSGPWNVFDPFGNSLASICSGTTTQCLQEFITYTAHNGYPADLSCHGVNQVAATQNGTTSSGSKIITGLTSTAGLTTSPTTFVTAAAGTNVPPFTTVTSIDSSTQIHVSNNATGNGSVSLSFNSNPVFISAQSGIAVPAVEQWSFDAHDCNLTFASTVNGPGLQFDSAMITHFGWYGGQIVYQPATPGGTSYAVYFNPTNPVPADGIITITGSDFFISNIAAPAGSGSNVAVWSFNISNGSIVNNHFGSNELNGTGSGSTPNTQDGILAFGATSNTSFEQNILDIADIHLVSAAGIQEGTGATNQGNYRNNIYRLGGIRPGSAAACLSTFGSFSKFYGVCSNEEAVGSVAQGLNFQSGSIGHSYDMAMIGVTTPLINAGKNHNGILNGVVQQAVGGASAQVTPSGKLAAQLTPTGNGADTTEDTLQTFSFPANGFDAVGRCVKIEAWGTFAANADSKTVRLYFGVVFYNSTGLTLSNGAWYVWGRVCKTGSNTQTSIATGTFLNSIPVTNAGSLSQTDTSAITIKVTGQAGTANANDIVANGMTVTMEN